MLLTESTANCQPTEQYIIKIDVNFVLDSVLKTFVAIHVILNCEAEMSYKSVKNISDIVGEWGLWQKNITFFCVSISLFSALNNLSYSFYAPNITYHCADNTTNQVIIATIFISFLLIAFNSSPDSTSRSDPQLCQWMSELGVRPFSLQLNHY